MKPLLTALIAKRVIGKGDTWQLISGESNQPEGIEYPSLTEVLEAYYQKMQIKCEFLIIPHLGEIHIVGPFEVEEKVEVKTTPKRFNIYGDY